MYTHTYICISICIFCKKKKICFVNLIWVIKRDNDKRHHSTEKFNNLYCICHFQLNMILITKMDIYT